MDDGGFFGRWAEDESGLPRFDLDISNLSRQVAVLPEGDPGRMWHQVGNDRITALAHAGGWSTLYSTEGGFVRLSGIDPGRPERLGGMWSVNAGGRQVLSPCSEGVEIAARWGVGYAEWSACDVNTGLVRRLWAPFGEFNFLRVDVELTAVGGPGLQAGEYVEKWGFAPYPVVLGGLMSRRIPAPAGYSLRDKLVWHAVFTLSCFSRYSTEMLRGLLFRGLTLDGRYVPELNAVVLGARKNSVPEKPSPFAFIPGVVFVASLSEACRTASVARERSVTTVSLRVPLVPDAGSMSLSFAVGFADRGRLAETIESARNCRHEETFSAWSRVAKPAARAWPECRREARWHSYYLRSAKVRDGYFGCSYVPQGSAYSFVHGLQGTPRDYALSAVPLARIDPAGAKDILRMIMRMTRKDGSIYYSHTGAGACTGALVHASPTDLPLFFLWALCEYLEATGERDFLEEEVEFYTRGKRRLSGTVRERVLLAWRYLRYSVGVGAHGLLRVGSGDWMDPISAMVIDRSAFRKEGESTFNSAMAVYVLPLAAGLLERSDPVDALEMAGFAENLREAVENTWNGRWFLRGYDGRGGPVGDDHLFLDVQAWCLIAEIGPPVRRLELIRTIAELCDEPSPVGATVLDRPHHIRGRILADGWDCNGGVWAAINGLLAWAYALHDRELAMRNVRKQSLAAHARAYPHVWYGIWSGPDSYNSYYAERPGETFIHPATPMVEFPVMNSNAHAGPLIALLKTAGRD